MDSEKNTPAISKTAFNCPHCGAYTTQYWYKIFADAYSEKHRTPRIPDVHFIEHIKRDTDIPEKTKDHFINWAKRMLSGNPFIEESEDSSYKTPILNNCNMTKYYNCGEIAVWIHDKIVFPTN